MKRLNYLFAILILASGGMLVAYAPYPARDMLEESAKKLVENFTWMRCAKVFEDIVKRGI